jgi:hypothetical protein
MNVVREAGDNMIRTQINLDEHDYDSVKAEYAGFVASADPHSSQSIDDVVY